MKKKWKEFWRISRISSLYHHLPHLLERVTVGNVVILRCVGYEKELLYYKEWYP